MYLTENTVRVHSKDQPVTSVRGSTAIYCKMNRLHDKSTELLSAKAHCKHNLWLCFEKLHAGDWMTEESGFYSQHEKWDIPLFSIVWSDLGPPSLLSKSKKVFFPVGFCGRSMNLPTHIHVLPKLRTHGATPALVHTPWQYDAEADGQKLSLILSLLLERKIRN